MAQGREGLAREALGAERLGELFPQLAEIRDETLRHSVAEVWAVLWERSEYARIEDVPVSLTVDYPQLRHTQAVVRMALAAADAAEAVHGATVDRDALIAGALLMDSSKLVEYRPDGSGGNERTEIGRLLPHGTVAAELARERGVPLEVVHIVLAHSPNGGKAPATVEAHILDWLDQLDLDAFGSHLWARRVVHFQP